MKNEEWKDALTIKTDKAYTKMIDNIKKEVAQAKEKAEKEAKEKAKLDENIAKKEPEELLIDIIDKRVARKLGDAMDTDGGKQIKESKAFVQKMRPKNDMSPGVSPGKASWKKGKGKGKGKTKGKAKGKSWVKGFQKEKGKGKGKGQGKGKTKGSSKGQQKGKGKGKKGSSSKGKGKGKQKGNKGWPFGENGKGWYQKTMQPIGRQILEFDERRYHSGLAVDAQVRLFEKARVRLRTQQQRSPPPSEGGNPVADHLAAGKVQ